MVVIHKDISFANIPGVDHGECYLDLYLPDNSTCSSQRENCDSNGDKYDTIKEVKNDRNDPLSAYSSVERIQSLKFDEVNDNGAKRLGLNRAEVGTSGVPFVLFIHGGGWRRGGRASWKHFLYFDVNFLVSFLQYVIGTYGNIGEALAANNIACAVISYPLSEAGPIVLMVEVILSYIQCVAFVSVTFLPVFGVLMFYRTFAHTHHVAYQFIFKDNDIVNIVRAYFLLALLLTNSVTTLLFFFKRQQFNITINEIIYFSVGLVASFVAVINSETPASLFIILTFTLNQGMIFYKRIQRHGCRYETQTMAVAQAVKWAKSFSQDTGITDCNSLYVMGHSAGGHLATMSALDDSILASVDCSTRDLKGVISISGVYDLFCLNKHFLRHVYLLPTFGRSSATWFKSSPEHVAIETKDTGHGKRFLLILAENDMFLKAQSFKFAKTLQEMQHECRHVEISKTNHFNIITGTNTGQGTALSYVLDFVK